MHQLGFLLLQVFVVYNAALMSSNLQIHFTGLHLAQTAQLCA